MGGGCTGRECYFLLFSLMRGEVETVVLTLTPAAINAFECPLSLPVYYIQQDCPS